MRRINRTDAMLIIAGMLAAFFYGADREAYLIHNWPGAFLYTLSITGSTVIILVLAASIAVIIERGYLLSDKEKQQGAVTGRTERQWREEENEFTDPEAEAMWNRAQYFHSIGEESPKGFISYRR